MIRKEREESYRNLVILSMQVFSFMQQQNSSQTLLDNPSSPARGLGLGLGLSGSFV
jgi:hypothetical protein